MSQILIPIKTFLGKYYPELLSTADTDKYKETSLRTFFEQRFFIQGNKTQVEMLMLNARAQFVIGIVQGRLN